MQGCLVSGKLPARRGVAFMARQPAPMCRTRQSSSLAVIAFTAAVTAAAIRLWRYSSSRYRTCSMGFATSVCGERGTEWFLFCRSRCQEALALIDIWQFLAHPDCDVVVRILDVVITVGVKCGEQLLRHHVVISNLSRGQRSISRGGERIWCTG